MTTFNQSVSGSLAPTGQTVRQTNHVISAALARTGSITRRAIGHMIAGAMRGTGGLTPSQGTYQKRFSGALHLVGQIPPRQIFTHFLGDLVFLGDYNIASSKKLATLLGAHAKLFRGISHKTSGTLHPSGAMTKRTTHSFRGSLVRTGHVTKQSLHSFFSSLVLSPLPPATGPPMSTHTFMSNETLMGNQMNVTNFLTKQTRHGLTATLRGTGAVTKRINRKLLSNLIRVGRITKQTPRSFSSSVAVGAPVPPATRPVMGAHTWMSKDTLIGNQTTINNLRIQTNHRIAAALHLVGNLPRPPKTKLLVGSLTVASSTLRRMTRKLMKGILKRTGDLEREHTRHPDPTVVPVNDYLDVRFYTGAGDRHHEE